MTKNEISVPTMKPKNQYPYNIGLQLFSNNRSFESDLFQNKIWSFFVDPWNPCDTGYPILATKPARNCYFSDTLEQSIDKYKLYQERRISYNYTQIEMKIVYNDVQCIEQYFNFTQNASNFEIEFCENYFADYNQTSDDDYMTVNDQYLEYADYCLYLQQQCPPLYEMCYGYTTKTCTCFCPRDRTGLYCTEYRSYECNLNILNADMDVCQAMTQKELNDHGQSDYDITVDGDKPCFFIPENGKISSVIQLFCYFTGTDDVYVEDVYGNSVYDNLIGYDINIPDNETMQEMFTYCLGSYDSLFALSEAPVDCVLRIKIFNFEQIFNNDQVSYFSLNESHFSGDGYVYHEIMLDGLLEEYRIGGRIYIEYQLWKDLDRISVERRFYDVDGWQMPISGELSEVEIWIIVVVVGCLLVVGYCLFKCNRWCKTIEYQTKND